MFENATEVCRCLGSLCDNLNEISVFGEFVAIIYDRFTNTNKVNESHLDLNARSNVHITEFLPQSRSCCAYQNICLTIITYMGAIAMQVANFTIAIQLGLG